MDTPLPAASRTRSGGGSSTVPSSPSSPLASVFTERSPSQSSHYRKLSDASYKPVDFGPRASGRNEPSGYQFSGIYNPLGASTQQMPLRAAQRDSSSAKKAGPTSLGALGEALRSSDLSNLVLPGERGRKASGGLSSRLSGSSRSPHNRLTSRSRSPATFAPKLASSKAYLNDGQVVDLSNAYRRLTDANLAGSGGSLSQLPKKKVIHEAGEGRLIKDYLGPDGEHLGSSEEDEPYSTDDEDRGRKKTPRTLNSDVTSGNNQSVSRSRSPGVQRKTLSLLAAAEEERMCFIPFPITPPGGLNHRSDKHSCRNPNRFTAQLSVQITAPRTRDQGHQFVGRNQQTWKELGSPTYQLRPQAGFRDALRHGFG